MLQVSRPIAEELLARYVNQGQALVERASLVGDSTDYEAWKAARKQWIEQTAQALGHIYGGPQQAEEFKSAATSVDGGGRWQQQYASDLACVQKALAMLASHQRECGFGEEPDGLPEPTEEPDPGSQPMDEPQQSGRTSPKDEPDSPADFDPVTEVHRVAVPPVEEPLPSARSADELEPSQEPSSPPAPAPVAEAEPDRGAQLAPASTVGAELAPAPTNGAGVVRKPGNGAVSSADRMRQVFLAHGRDQKWMQAVANLLERAGPHAVTVLNERQDDRKTLAEQFGEQVAGSQYAVVLLTADDVGAPRLHSEEEPYYSPRARQGVVFEMGFLVAALSPSCVCVLYEDGVELPCDLDGIAYVRLDFAGTWQSKLLLHLRKAGFDYDLNKLAPV
jgi:predicted nucleotide-binding protein